MECCFSVYCSVLLVVSFALYFYCRMLLLYYVATGVLFVAGGFFSVASFF